MQERARAGRLRKTIVLTPSEKKAVVFVFIAFVLGFAAKEYRAAHPHGSAQQQVDVAAKQNHSPSRRPSPSPTPPEHADPDAD